MTQVVLPISDLSHPLRVLQIFKDQNRYSICMTMSVINLALNVIYLMKILSIRSALASVQVRRL